jgi:ABC-type glycerol-3-phosphate transport system permease component
MRKYKKFSASLVFSYLIATSAILFTLFPVIWIGMISIKTQRDAFAMPPVWFFKPIWANYIKIWSEGGFAHSFLISLEVVVLGLFLSLALSIPAAYAMNRLQFNGKRGFSVWMLLCYMFPEFLFIIPMYIIYQKIGLFDTVIGLAIAYQVIQLPFCIWLLRDFFKDIPSELEDAALIDGCNKLQVLQKVYIPLAAPGIAATAILSGIWIWNEMAIALALTFSDAKTITIAAASFRGYASIDWGAMTAASMISIIPMLFLTAFAQKYIVNGLTLGGVK